MAHPSPKPRPIAPPDCDVVKIKTAGIRTHGLGLWASMWRLRWARWRLRRRLGPVACEIMDEADRRIEEATLRGSGE